MKNSIGIIGGMGPKASLLFYRKIINMIPAECDQDYINLIIMNDADMPDRTAAILSGNYYNAYEELLEDALQLEKIGCNAIGITCNTAHFFADMIKDQINIPIINMVRETIKKVEQDVQGDLIGLMATDGTIKTGLYQCELENRGVSVYVPEAPIQSEVMYQIYGCIKSGKPADMKSWSLIEADYKKAGCGKVILGCTELSVIKEECCLSDWYIDPMDVLAEKVLEFYNSLTADVYDTYILH